MRRATKSKFDVSVGKLVLYSNINGQVDELHTDGPAALEALGRLAAGESIASVARSIAPTNDAPKPTRKRKRAKKE